MRNNNKYSKLLFSLIILVTIGLGYEVKAANDPLVDDDYTVVLRAMTADGGGTRGGVTTVEALTQFERELKGVRLSPDEVVESYRKNEELTGRSISETFHAFFGTSAGGIEATAFAAGVTLEQFHELFQAKQGDIFSKPSFVRKIRTGGGYLSPLYDPTGYEQVARDLLGETNLSDVDHCILGVMTDDVTRGQERLFLNTRTRDAKGAIVEKEDISLVDLVLSTGAAPTYLPRHTVHCSDGTSVTYMDGGVDANNPALDAWIQTSKELLRRPYERGGLRVVGKSLKVQIFSLGTGLFDTSMPGAGTVDTVKYIVGKATQTERTHRQMTDLVRDPRQYYRWNVELPNELGLLDSTDEALLGQIQDFSYGAWSSWDRKGELLESYRQPRSTEVEHQWINFSKQPNSPVEVANSSGEGEE